MLGLFLREVQQGPEFLGRGFVDTALNVPDYERYDVLLHKAEQVQIAMRTQVVDSQFFFVREKVETVRIDPHLGQEGLAEIEDLLATDDVIDLPRAVQYHHLAAQQALQRSEYQEAITHLSRGLELLQHLPGSLERIERELAMQIALGAALRNTKAFGAPDTEHAYLRALELCR